MTDEEMVAECDECDQEGLLRCPSGCGGCACFKYAPCLHCTDGHGQECEHAEVRSGAEAGSDENREERKAARADYEIDAAKDREWERRREGVS